MKLHAFIAGLAALACLPNAHAVYVSPDGRGQALIYPYYTAQGNNDTLFSIVSPISYGGSSAPRKAVKVRFFEGRNGRSVLEFNLYLARGKTWTAAVTRDATGRPVLRTFDPACTVPRFGPSSVYPAATEIAFTNANYAGYDRAGSSLDRAKEGHFEVIEMGEIDAGFLLNSGVSLVDAITPGSLQDCAAVAAAWNAGGAFLSSGGAELTAPSTEPSYMLLGHALIINVPQGTEYSYDPVALGRLFAAKRHTGPGDAHPNLGDADPTSLVLANGISRQSTWSTGIDAVSAVLTHKKIINEYVGPPTATAPVSSDVIVSFPTKSFYVVRESDAGQTTRAPFRVKFDDLDDVNGTLLAEGMSKGACEQLWSLRFSRAGTPNFDTVFMRPADTLFLCWQTSVISFGNVLDSANAILYSGVLPAYTTSGTINVTLDSPDLSFPFLTSLEGHIYPGLPVAGFAMQRRINGDLGGVRANYGGTSMHKYETGLE
ncbi:MAG TPA: hypothetical protein VN283_05020 [Thiobacillus sp.]|nr:hypothetical protein [Thiobacillus sp.]